MPDFMEQVIDEMRDAQEAYRSDPAKNEGRFREACAQAARALTYLMEESGAAHVKYTRPDGTKGIISWPGWGLLFYSQTKGLVYIYLSGEVGAKDERRLKMALPGDLDEFANHFGRIRKAI